MDISSWYSLVGKDHYAFSEKFKELEFHHKKVAYLKPIALGVFDINDYGNLPTDEESWEFENLTKVELEEYNYILGDKMDLLRNNIDTNNIILKEGIYYLVELVKKK